MAVSPHPSVKPAKPHKPPSGRAEGVKRESGEAAPYGAEHEFGGYEHSKEHSPNDYGHQMSMKHHETHKSEFDGGKHFPKAGDKE